MGFYTSFAAVFADIKTTIEAVSAIKNVVLSEQFRVTSLPMAVINPEPLTGEPADIDTTLKCNMEISIVLIIRETEPDDVFAELASPMGDVVDAIYADITLGNTVEDCYLSSFIVGEILIQSKLYYGGEVRFRAWMHFTP